MKIASIGGLMSMFIMGSVSGAGLGGPGAPENQLPPCPDSPNCVSTQSESKRHSMAPLPYLQTREASRERILSILKGMKRTEIVKLTESTIHVEFRTAIWGFVDDVEFLFDDAARVVHFRSASRSGYYDFGLNRRRMKEISERYLEAVENETTA
ncbi:MAG: DUF1499 domain-containing protein [Desulfobacteraceae bacterium]|jgi:uncharacterized protein (DUF1499 family)